MIYGWIKIFIAAFLKNSAKVKKCFNDESYVTLSNGERKILKDVVVGDKVKTLDANGHLIDTDIIMLMDKSNEKCKNKKCYWYLFNFII